MFTTLFESIWWRKKHGWKNTNLQLIQMYWHTLESSRPRCVPRARHAKLREHTVSAMSISLGLTCTSIKVFDCSPEPQTPKWKNHTWDSAHLWDCISIKLIQCQLKRLERKFHNNMFKVTIRSVTNRPKTQTQQEWVWSQQCECHLQSI
jgi:hypothetical protein